MPDGEYFLHAANTYPQSGGNSSPAVIIARLVRRPGGHVRTPTVVNTSEICASGEVHSRLVISLQEEAAKKVREIHKATCLEMLDRIKGISSLSLRRSDAILRLKRQIEGHLNRLSDPKGVNDIGTLKQSILALGQMVKDLKSVEESARRVTAEARMDAENRAKYIHEKEIAQIEKVRRNQIKQLTKNSGSYNGLTIEAINREAHRAKISAGMQRYQTVKRVSLRAALEDDKASLVINRKTGLTARPDSLCSVAQGLQEIAISGFKKIASEVKITVSAIDKANARQAEVDRFYRGIDAKKARQVNSPCSDGSEIKKGWRKAASAVARIARKILFAGGLATAVAAISAPPIIAIGASYFVNKPYEWNRFKTTMAQITQRTRPESASYPIFTIHVANACSGGPVCK